MYTLFWKTFWSTSEKLVVIVGAGKLIDRLRKLIERNEMSIDSTQNSGRQHSVKLKYPEELFLFN